MNLNPKQKDVLKAMVTQTLKTRGKNRGDIKGIVPKGTFPGATLSALARHGLVAEAKTSDNKPGYVATLKALEI